MKKVAFQALIKEIKHKSLRSADKSTYVVLEFNSSEETELLNTLNELHIADGLVAVAIAEMK